MPHCCRRHCAPPATGPAGGLSASAPALPHASGPFSSSSSHPHAHPHPHAPPIPALVRRVELVVLHVAGSEALPSDTAAWLTRRPTLARHHHVRLEYQADVAR